LVRTAKLGLLCFTQMIEETLRASRVGNSSTFGNRLWRYGPVIIWAGAIFIFSSSLFSGSNTSSVLRPLVLWVYPSATEPGLAFVHALIRKAGHFVEYAVLAVLAARAFRTSFRDFLRNHWFAVSLTLVALYALSDEFHQSLVSSRTASIYDCLIDTAGGLVALIIVRVRTASGSDRIKQSS
jgi:VanZ family protein